MKMVKSLLLGTAAGLVAMSGAQAADLPVKAKPVQYVKICSLYGAGFYYIPGTDMCIKIGGYVRQQIGYGVAGNLTNGANASGLGVTGDLANRATQDVAMRARGYITADARNQTEYGTVRSYIAVGLSQGVATGTTNGADASSGAGFFNANRAFIQFAGFTFGITQSFYDFYSGPATSFFGGLINPSSDTGDAGKQVTAYTAQFGGGLTATIGIEGQRNTGVFNTSTVTFSPIAAPTASSQQGMKYPDLVANLRVDQAWGGAQIMAALHDASANYYGTTTALQTTAAGNPGNKVGFAIGAGIKLLAPMIGPGDYFQAQVNYAQGASGYVNAGTAGLYTKYNGGAGGSYGFGIMSDSIYSGVAGSSLELTTSWGINAAYDHYWNKSWKTSLYGAYIATNYTAVANTALCAGEAATISVTAGTCNNNWAVWNIGSRTAWNVDSQTEIGIDIVYSSLKTANSGAVGVQTATSTQPSVSRSYADQGSWMGQFRIHRNFYP